MKRSWPTYLMIGGLAVLLVALGVLQYRWLSHASAAEADKERRRVSEQAHRFAQDFNREIQNAYFVFQTEADAWQEGDWSGFNDRYRLWKEQSQYPDLIREIYFLDADNQAESLKYVPDTGFEPAEIPDEVKDLAVARHPNARFSPVDEGTLTLLLPVHGSNSDRGQKVVRFRSPEMASELKFAGLLGCLAIRLDGAVLMDQVVRDLTARHFGDGDYRLTIAKSERDLVGTPDAAAPLFDLASDSLMFTASRELISTLQDNSAEKVMVDTHVQTHSVRSVQEINSAGEKTKVMVKRSGLPRTGSLYTATLKEGPPAPWTLLVQHSAGSVDAYAASTLRRNLAAGFGLLSLVALAIGAIIISSLRARSFAQRQIDFVSSVSHEFRTPLSVIYSAGENLADGVARDRSQISRYGDLIKGEGRKLSAMVEQILDFAGANSGKRRFNLTETSVDQVVRSAVADCRQLIADSDADISVSIRPDIPVIKADKTALSQAIQNLIANGLKYSNGQPQLRIAATNGGGRVKISVQDHGIGIARGEHKKIFEPFYRTKDVVDAQIHGNGLGLPLVKQIVEAHGGTISVESEPGQGSTFTIELPAN